MLLGPARHDRRRALLKRLRSRERLIDEDVRTPAATVLMIGFGRFGQVSAQICCRRAWTSRSSTSTSR